MPISTHGLHHALSNHAQPAYSGEVQSSRRHNPGASLTPADPLEAVATEKEERDLPDCSALFADGYVDADTACATILRPDVVSLLSRPIRKAWDCMARPQVRQRMTFEEFRHDVLTDVVMEKVIEHRGLRASDGDVRHPLAFLKTLCLRQALSKLRKGELRVVSEMDREGSPVMRADERHDPEAVIGWKREGQLMRAAALDPQTSLRSNLRFAFIAQSFPDALTEAHVDAAKVEAGKQVGQGILRSAAETWELLQRHLVARDVVPAVDEGGRLAFAWICRTRDETDPESWRSRKPEEAARALDLVAEWQKRAGTKVLSQLPESVVHTWRAQRTAS